MKAQKKEKFANFISTSFFVTVLNKISDFFISKIQSSKSAQFFTSFKSLSEKFSDSFFVRVFNKIRPSAKSVLKIKNSISQKIENSFFYTLYHKFIDLFFCAKVKTYGVFLFVYGFVSAGAGFIEKYALNLETVDNTVWWQGIAVLCFSLPLLFSKERLGNALVNSRFSNKILTFLGIKSQSVIKTSNDDTPVVAVVLALIFGLFSFLIQPIYLLLAVALLFVLAFVFHKPEFGLWATIVFLPFLPTMVICAEIIVVLFAYLLKVIRGKRSIKFGFLDISVLTFAVYMLFGGLFSVTASSSIPPVLVFLCFIVSYFLIVNLVKTKAFIKKIISSSLISFFVCSAYGIYQNFFVAPDTTWTDEDMFSEIETRVVSTFENPNVFGEYLILLIPLCIALFFVSKKASERFSYFLCLFTSIVALIYTWSRGAWLGCIASLIVFFVILSKRAISFYFLGVFALPLAIPFLPSSVTERFVSIGNMADSSTSYRVFIWEASVKMIKDYFFTGIGVGTDAFQTVYSEYALAGIETAPHSHNLYLQIMVELGIFGFAVFALTIALFIIKVFSYLKNGTDRSTKLISGAIMCGILAFLVQGITDYVWYNYRVFGIFWMLIALCVALINSSENEEMENKEIIM